ncbi:DUF6443 domain-containing protein [Flavobacterium sp. N1736]|uniref:DUF6443 domain-containing protein n=1 Tax=Flavobacterium sp. N1736 TaxID=2986823 RepID=UPI002224C70B|nr:DUF6443 domain-containing protein [Flavobacterium sp. N1736]
MIKNISHYIAVLLFFITAVLQAQSSNENYTFNRTFNTPMTTVNGIKNKSDVKENITYFDGLGRPVQTIAIGQGGDGSNIVTHIEYDGFGRQEKEYLPFSSNGNGSYSRIDAQSAFDATHAYYQTDIYENTMNPFFQKKLEASPLSRVLKQAAPGTDWAMDKGHEIKIDYQTNQDNEVRLFEAITSWNAATGLYDISFWDNGYYPKNELYKTITYDENSAADPLESNGSIVEFKNQEGLVVLRRLYESGQKHDTYYVFDEYNNKTYVIPPKAADGVISDEVLNNLCYQYKYDYRNREVEKKIPGKQWEFTVFDKQNHVVATGPANSPFQDDTATGWLITKYDALGRSIYTGWRNATVNTQTRYSLQEAQNAVIPVTETKPGSGTIEGITIKGANAPTSGLKILSATYYDDYKYPKIVYEPYYIGGQKVDYENSRLITGSWTRVPTTASAVLGETNTVFYDAKKRPIEEHVENHLGGFTLIDYMLDFTGKTLIKFTAHRAMTSGFNIEVVERFTYSAQDRLLTHTHKVNEGPVELLADNTYDALGKLIGKNVGNTTENPLQKIDYKYNIRGWLTNINNINNLEEDNASRDLFAFKINYNNPEAIMFRLEALYNGNIAETFWATNSDGGIIRGYGYRYDNLNRLKSAIYQIPKLTDSKNYFGENLVYDKNGNIKSLERMFMAGISTNPYADHMDNLDYFYANNSNQLMKVTDKSNNPQGFKDDSDGYNDTEDDYAYDANGNLIKDQNKKIVTIDYNHLNLPLKTTFAAGNTIEYIYTASGQKVEKIVTENNVVTNTKYLSGFHYKNDILQFFPTAEGYVRNTSVNPATRIYGYVYNFLDHIGNVRLSYAKNTATNKLEILEENNYYAFGLAHKGYNSDNKQIGYNYKYQGQERQDELGLNWDSFKWRNYMPDLGRFFNIDPLAEKYEYNSTYAFQENKMGMGRELEGLELAPRNPTASFGGWFSSKYDSAVQTMQTTVSNIMGAVSVGTTTERRGSDKSGPGGNGIAFSDGGNNQDPSALPKGGRDVLWIDFGGSLEAMTTVAAFELGFNGAFKGKGTNGGKPTMENKIDDGISAVDNAASGVKTIAGEVKKKIDKPDNGQKRDSVRETFYAKDGTEIRTEIRGKKENE